MQNSRKKKNQKSSTVFGSVLSFNIGAFLFGAILIYIIISAILYLTGSRQEIYQVTIGTLSQNTTYNALILRDETVVTAKKSGYLNSIVANGKTAASGETVCAIGDSKSDQTMRTLSDEDKAELRALASDFASNYNRNHFGSVSDLNFSIHSLLYASAGDASGDVYRADASGLVVYSSDGYEGKSVEDLTASDFNTKSYRKQQHSSDSAVEAGDTLYKLITDTDWSIVLELGDAQLEQLQNRKSVRVRFAKDGKTQTGSVSLFDRDNHHYAQISFQNGVSRYCTDRFTNVELVTSTATGLKLPKSAIVEKEFYLIPKSYATEGGENGSTGFLKEVTDGNGEKTTSFVDATIYEETSGDEESSAGTTNSTSTNSTSPAGTSESGYYYVSTEDFSKGDVIVRADSNDRYTIGNTAPLEGVYCTNRGYADFRKIKILEENDESCIVATGTSYGLTQYDFIVRDSSTVKESDLIRRK